MGCCLSSTTTAPPPRSSKPTKSSGGGGFSKSPPPTHPIVEEEAVKEVLLETPAHYHNLQIRPNQINSNPTSTQLPLNFSTTAQNGVVRRINNNNNNKPSIANTDDHFEICSDVSDTTSISTAETKIELRRRSSPAKSRNRPYSGEIKIRERSVGVSPGRRSEISPNRSSGYGRRKDSGEISGRRSRSPAATRGEVAGRKTGRSPGRVGPDRIRKEGGLGMAPTTAGNESLENPLVSLECFIFL